jgi:hypothetical protein
MKKLRSSIIATVEAPQRPQDSFNFLALPVEIRMYVYHLCLVSNTEIPLDEGQNSYYVIHYTNDHPSVDDSLPTTVELQGGSPPPAPTTITVNVPTNFSYPSTTNSMVNFVPPAPKRRAKRPVVPQILPLASVVQPADMTCLPTRPESAKTPFSDGTGVYIGPVCSNRCSYLPPCQYAPFAPFNARLLQTCKTVYAEALPVLYSKNQFLLHFPLLAKPALGKLNGQPLAHLTDLRLEVFELDDILNVGENKSLWSSILRQCTQLQKITFRFTDKFFLVMSDYTSAIIRIAANIANVRKRTGEPTMTVNTLLGVYSPLSYVRFSPEQMVSKLQSAIAEKHSKMQVPRGITVELTGRMSVLEYSVLQGYTEKGWCFRRKSPENAEDVVDGAWVELEWVKM